MDHITAYRCCIFRDADPSLALRLLTFTVGDKRTTLRSCFYPPPLLPPKCKDFVRCLNMRQNDLHSGCAHCGTLKVSGVAVQRVIIKNHKKINFLFFTTPRYFGSQRANKRRRSGECAEGYFETSSTQCFSTSREIMEAGDGAPSTTLLFIE